MQALQLQISIVAPSNVTRLSHFSITRRQRMAARDGSRAPSRRSARRTCRNEKRFSPCRPHQQTTPLWPRGKFSWNPDEYCPLADSYAKFLSWISTEVPQESRARPNSDGNSRGSLAMLHPITSSRDGKWRTSRRWPFQLSASSRAPNFLAINWILRCHVDELISSVTPRCVFSLPGVGTIQRDSSAFAKFTRRERTSAGLRSPRIFPASTTDAIRTVPSRNVLSPHHITLELAIWVV